MLNNSNIEFIENDLQKRGLIYEPLKDEIIDHICSSIENEMRSGIRFADAYKKVLIQFGDTQKLQVLQQETIKSQNFNAIAMIRNYLKSSYRNLSKNKFFTFINVFGLAVSISIAITILMYVKDELSYDKHFADAERIYRITADHHFNGNVFKASVTPAPMAKTLQQEFPEIEAAMRFRNIGSIIFIIGDRKFKESEIMYADSTTLDVFTLPILEGGEKLLVNPESIIISESTAKRWFGNTSAVGKNIKDADGTDHTITGVFKDIPKNSHFKADVFLAMSGYGRAQNERWLSNNFHTYIKLKKGTRPDKFEEKLKIIVNKYIGPQFYQFLNKSLEEAAKEGNTASYHIQPLTEIYLHSNLVAELSANSDYQYIIIFSSIAIFILIIACINFMNLSTARSSIRAKEVGIRKALGSYRSHLIKQFLIESILLTTISYIIALLITQLSLPFFNDLAGKQLSIPFEDSFFIPMSILGIILLGFLAGIYPSMILSSFKTTEIIKGKFHKMVSGAFFRNVLVVFQFTISILLIIGSMAIYKQLNFIKSKNLGYEKEQVLIINDPYLLGDQSESFRDNLKNIPGISSASLSGYLPVSASNRSDNTYFKYGSFEVTDGVNMQSWSVDHNYLDVLKLELKEGRNFKPGYDSDKNSLVLNESAVIMFGFEEPLGEKIVLPELNPDGTLNEAESVTYTVIGVVSDFNFNSLKENISPLCFRNRRSFSALSVRFETVQTESVIKLVEKEWKAIDSSQPFSYAFLEDHFNNMYKSESKTGILITLFAGTAIIIACLGLFALSAFSAERRIKEVGIRKVMGASMSSILMLLSGSMIKLVLISFILTIPIAIYGIDLWLSDFAYKIYPSVWNYSIAGIIAIFIAITTIWYQAFKAANSSPADTLKAD